MKTTFRSIKLFLSIFLIFLICTHKSNINKTKFTGTGFGKIILFNEHFVVYGTPAIAASLPNKITATIIKSDKFELHPKVIEEGEPLQAIEKILKLLNIKKEKAKFAINFDGNIIPGSGIGSSAAFAVASIKSLSNYLKLNLSNEKINQIAYEVEKIFHKDPSGIDNTISTYQGLIWFKKSNTNTFKQIKIKEPLIFVIGQSGKKGSSKKAIAKVKKLKDKNPENFNLLLKKANKLASKSLQAMENFDLQKIGKLMDKNHKLLQEIKVSTPEIDKLVSIAKENGALGAKLTGGGLGGNIIALAKNKASANKIVDAFRENNFDGFIYFLGHSSLGPKSDSLGP